MVKERWKLCKPFPFKQVNIPEVLHQLGQLNSKKLSPISSNSADVLRKNADIFDPILERCFKASVEQKQFPETLIAGGITSIFKKDDAFCKKNYRPITILPSASKIYER